MKNTNCNGCRYMAAENDGAFCKMHQHAIHDPENNSCSTYMPPVPDMVNRPPHYTGNGIECIDAMQSAFGEMSVISFCQCNAFKYVWRCNMKNDCTEDMKKAIWYLNKAIELLND